MGISKYEIILTKFKTIYLLILLGIILLMLYMILLSPKNNENLCEKEKNMRFMGVITSIKLDSFNLSRMFIVLDKGQRIITPFTYGLWLEVNVGDSIIKEKGSLNYTIYINGNIANKKILNWDIPCED